MVLHDKLRDNFTTRSFCSMQNFVCRYRVGRVNDLHVRFLTLYLLYLPVIKPFTEGKFNAFSLVNDTAIIIAQGEKWVTITKG